jgi:hypothetical protein
MGREQHGIFLLRLFKNSTQKPDIDIDEALTFSHVVHAENFYGKALSFEVQYTALESSRNAAFGLDIIFNMDKVMIFCYFP